MLDMLMGRAGRTVTIQRPSVTYDEEMNKVTTWGDPETLDGVLIAQGEPEGVWDRDHDGGVICDYTLGIPMGYTQSWKGCKVTLPEPWDVECVVVSDARYGDPALMPSILGKWGGVVGLVVSHG